MLRREDGERGSSKSDGGPTDLKKTQWQGREHLCDTGMPVRNGNPGNDRTTTAKVANVQKQLGTKNSKSDEGGRTREEWWS